MAPKMDITSFSSTTPVVKDDSIGNSASTITNDNHNDAATVAKTTSNDNNSDNTEDDDAIFLRWSRITKSVTIKTDGSGLLRGSIAAPTEDLTFRKAVRKQLSQFSLPSMTIGNIDRQNKNTKTILDEVSGYAAPGEILAMMGPSGSGKTSLLDCLSGRNPYNSGVVSVNGKLLGGSDMKRLMTKIAYVKQADIFFEHLTVRDQLGYTAMMRLPEKWTKQKKLGEVEEIIRLLRLTKVAESKIQTLSGGEKKRVNIGTELLTDPNVLLLDEPTSGLDSTSAVALIRMLQKLARNSNKTIITSIHQPSSALFQSFDRLIMLAEGHVVYFGKPKNSLHYLRQHKLDCPDGYNLADHWMDLLVQDSAIEGDNDNDNDNDTDNYECECDVDGSYHKCVIKTGSTPSMSSSTDEKDVSIDNEHDGQDRMSANETNNTNTSSYRLRQDRSITHFMDLTKRQQLIRAWDGEAVAEQMDLLVEQVKTYRLSLPLADTKNEPKNQVSKYNTTWGLQYRTLVHRSLKNSRSAIFTPINLVKSCALGVLSGLLWFQMDYSESRIFDRSSYFFFTMTFWVFDAMFQSFLMFPAERAVVLKERASGSYKLSAYFMGKTTSEMPARLALPLIYMVISFWMAAISSQFSMFVATTVISLLSVIAGEAIGLLIGATIYDVDKGMTVMTVVSLFLALIGGFFVQKVPPFLLWAKYLSPFKYSFDASLQLVFDKPIPCDGSGVVESICHGNEEGTISPEAVLDFLGVQGSVGFNVGILLAMGLVPRYIAYLALRGKKEGDR
uniref:ABC transporter domain-containing protein n=1 Tax=Pseudo-nitzschia australis TaxID=44445 RepID=A0A7S4AW38_9STRA|mmetsp:Transcript_5545/g.12157  ORF Transcript_5545/g.12157 Transcript_5545/m.12157 type:complete len:783 (-) Transcript_5545:312-2660(-)